ncbi:MAG: RNA polymerase sigma factor [Deltaproteobacteria bacterium]|nr:RNA polymerase sigma factor [Deltaproteobacteria bacterium]
MTHELNGQRTARPGAGPCFSRGFQKTWRIAAPTGRRSAGREASLFFGLFLSPADTPDGTLEEWMERYADGDETAFASLYDHVRPILFGRLVRKVGPTTAEDLVQATFLKLHAHRQNYRTGTAVLPWLFTISDRLAIDAFRRLGRDPQTLTSDGTLPETGEAPEPPDPLLSEALRVALETLPDHQKEVVILNHFHDMDLADVARRLGLDPATVRVRKHRAFAQLRKKLRGVAEERT